MDRIFSVILGVILGALISAIGYLVKTRQERHRVFNESLFNLLEVWHYARVSFPPNVDEVLNTYKAEVKRRFPSLEMTDELLNEPTNAIKEHSEALTKELTAIGESELLESYEEAISKLSKEVPILAYELNGHQHLKFRLDQLDTYLKSLQSNMVSKDYDEKTEEIVKGLFNQFTEEAKSDLFCVLEKDLLRLAELLGIRVKREVRKKIMKARTDDKESIDKLVSQLVDKIENRVISSNSEM